MLLVKKRPVYAGFISSTAALLGYAGGFAYGWVLSIPDFARLDTPYGSLMRRGQLDDRQFWYYIGQAKKLSSEIKSNKRYEPYVIPEDEFRLENASQQRDVRDQLERRRTQEYKDRIRVRRRTEEQFSDGDNFERTNISDEDVSDKDQD